MAELRMPREYYLRRAVECYEGAGEPRAAAELLAQFGTPAASAEAARRYLALGDLPAAGEAFLAAQQPRAALACFQRARLPQRALACLQQLGDQAAAAALLLELGRPQEAAPLLERALAAAQQPAERARLRLLLAQALGAEAGEAHYRAGLAELARLPATGASALAWAALGAWGAALGRQDRAQEGYAQALRLLAGAGEWAGWRELARRYQAAATAMGNRRLAQQLERELAERAEGEEPGLAAAEPALELLAGGRWAEALALLEPRARGGEEAARALLASVIEGPGVLERGGAPAGLSWRPAAAGAAEGAGERRWAPLELRLRAAELLGEVGDPRLLDPRRGDAPLGGYWCPIEPGPFWFGDDQIEELRQVTLPYAYRIGRYPVTNAEYARFIEAGGYHERRWWTEQGWLLCQRQSWRAPRHWTEETRNRSTQPVVGVTWWECAAYCAWLSEMGRGAGWLQGPEVIRLPTRMEWERAARGTDRRIYPWGDETPDAERANYGRKYGHQTIIGLFPAGAASCGALDMSGNVNEWLATPWNDTSRIEAKGEFVEDEPITAKAGGFSGSANQIRCGAYLQYRPFAGITDGSFRVVWHRVRNP